MLLLLFIINNKVFNVSVKCSVIKKLIGKQWCVKHMFIMTELCFIALKVILFVHKQKDELGSAVLAAITKTRTQNNRTDFYLVELD